MPPTEGGLGRRYGKRSGWRDLRGPGKKTAGNSSRADVEAFLGQVAALDPAVKGSERGRLIFALDATMSREPTWDQACQLQAECFAKRPSLADLIFNSSITEGSLNAGHRDGSLSQRTTDFVCAFRAHHLQG
jgi:hypothetical protein